MKFQVISFLLFVKWVTLASSSRILAAIPTQFYSHQVFYRPLWKELAARGHQVVLLTTHPMNENITNLEEIELSVILNSKKDLLISTSYVKQMELFFDATVAMFNEQLSDALVQALIHNASEHFDLFIGEFAVPPFFAFKERFKCPMIMVSSFNIFDIYHSMMGNPIHHLLYSYTKVIKDDMEFWDRVWAFLHMLEEDYLMRDYNHAYNDIVRRNFGEGYMQLQEVVKEIDMCFINTNVVTYSPRPITPATINIGGGMHLGNIANQKPKKLATDLQTFLDKSQHGVVYFNLGTTLNISSIHPNTKQLLLETFASVKYDILWNFENDTLLTISSNVIIIKWLPQFDVLRHNNVKLFITQGGLHSFEEALISGKPMIVFPFIADQHANAMRVKELGLGLSMNLLTVTAEQLKTSICNVIENPEFKRNVEKYSKIMQDVPVGPLERAVWWTEYVLRHKGAKHLKGKTLPSWKFYYLDVIAFLLTVFSTSTFSIILITKRILFCVMQNKKNFKEKKA